MEDPFLRIQNEKHVFPFMQEHEVSKFIITSSYLEKYDLDWDISV